MEIVKKIEPMFSPCFNDTRGLLEFEIVDGEKKKKERKKKKKNARYREDSSKRFMRSS